MVTYTGLFLLSAATLAFEVNLTRIFSVAQFYHFAFMIVSLALLGFGASGTFLTFFPRLQERDSARTLPWLSWGFALTSVGSYALTLYVPFDSFRIAHDWRQAVVLALHYVALATPFFCSGTAIALLLAAQPEQANRTYAANLTGSAAGCLLAVAAPSLAGGEGTVLLSAALGLLSALAFQSHPFHLPHPAPHVTHHVSRFTFHVSRFTFHASRQSLSLSSLSSPHYGPLLFFKSASPPTRASVTRSSTPTQNWSSGAGTASRAWTSCALRASAACPGADFCVPVPRRPRWASPWTGTI